MLLISDSPWSAPPELRWVPKVPQWKNDKQPSYALLGTARSSYANEARGDNRPAPACERARGFVVLPRATAAQPQITLRCRRPSCLAPGKEGGCGRVSSVTLSSVSGSSHLGAASSFLSRAFLCSDGGDGGSASESLVGLFRTPQPPPQILVHSSRERKSRIYRVSGLVEFWKAPQVTLDARLSRHKHTHTNTHLVTPRLNRSAGRSLLDPPLLP